MNHIVVDHKVIFLFESEAHLQTIRRPEGSGLHFTSARLNKPQNLACFCTTDQRLLETTVENMQINETKAEAVYA